MKRDFAAEIAAAQQRLEAFSLRMEEIKQRFIAETADFLKGWYWSQVDRTVKYRTEVTKALGVEKLSQLKVELGELQANSEKDARQFLDDEALWWHKKPKNQTYGFYGLRPPDSLDKAIRLAAGKLAPILETYGYLPKNSSDRDAWREWDSTGNHHPHNARPYYPNGLDWPEQMQNLLKEYATVQREGEKLFHEIAEMKRDKEKSEAEDLWNQA